MGSEPRSNLELRTAIQALGNKGFGIEGVHVYVRDRPPVEQHRFLDIRREHLLGVEDFHVSRRWYCPSRGPAQRGRSGPVPRWSPGDRSAPSWVVEEITIQHLITMSSGITYRWEDPDVDHPGDPASDILSTPLGPIRPDPALPTGAGVPTCSVASSTPARVRTFATTSVPRLFTPLGINNPQWHRCPLGYSIGAVGLHLRTEEIARLGRTLLENGRYGDHQLIPAEYVVSMTADNVPTHGHFATGAVASHPENAYMDGMSVVSRDDAWRMDGLYGQLCVILPHQQACVTITAHYQGATSDILDAIWSEVVPVLN